ncbi:hypothetical protein CWATWH0005_1228 [Crocosphaera watsonii WH 0005]|uniref:Uncharacterized protein n=1 Tax=Crocosphaera watsonii WH 0005 TaxID=423472 RepID=T2IN72_CROWT|nr:hypothetical protein CWATWH0005_1228 [Crocosphaera watsonii WH 0005]
MRLNSLASFLRGKYQVAIAVNNEGTINQVRPQKTESNDKLNHSKI